MTVKEALAVCKAAPTEDLSGITPERALEYQQAFATLVDVQHSAVCNMAGIDRNRNVFPNPKEQDKHLTTLNSIGVGLVKATGLVESICAFRSNNVKKLPASESLVSILARIALGRLQNVGDKFDIDLPNFNISFTAVEAQKISWNVADIIKKAGASIVINVENANLKDCIKNFDEPPINPNGCANAVNRGDLDPADKVITTSFDVAIAFSYKLPKDEEVK